MIAVIGSGFIGESLGSYYYSNNFKVIFYDISENVLKNLNKKGYDTTNDLNRAISESSYIFLTLPTPTLDGKIDLNAFINIFKQLKKIELKNKILIVKSTIIPGTTENLIIKNLEGQNPNDDFGVIYSPEFITEIAKTWNKDKKEISFENEDRIVIGESKNKKWGDLFIEEFIKNKSVPVIRTGYKEAETIKYVANTMLATKISFWNEVFLLSRSMGLNFGDISKGVSLDKRIGKYGTVAGKAFGGKCLPKDLEAFISFSENIKEMKLLKKVKEINDFMKENFGVRE